MSICVKPHKPHKNVRMYIIICRTRPAFIEQSPNYRTQGTLLYLHKAKQRSLQGL